MTIAMIARIGATPMIPRHQAPRFLRRQSIHQRPPVVGTQKSFFSDAPVHGGTERPLAHRTRECAMNPETQDPSVFVLALLYSMRNNGE
jgi:hypothetical protein